MARYINELSCYEHAENVNNSYKILRFSLLYKSTEPKENFFWLADDENDIKFLMKTAICWQKHQ